MRGTRREDRRDGQSLPCVQTSSVITGGMPFDVVVSGGFGLVSTGTGLAVMKTANFTPALKRKITLPTMAQGEALHRTRNTAGRRW